MLWMLLFPHIHCILNNPVTVIYYILTYLPTIYVEYIQYMITIYIYIAIILSGNNMQLL